MEYIESEIFWACVKEVEDFRLRRLDTTGKNQILLCTNVIFDQYVDLDWTHYLLKIIYSEVGIVFGKFEKGARLFATDREIEVPYAHIAIRSYIGNKDLRFFNKTMFLYNSIQSSNDQGQSVISYNLDEIKKLSFKLKYQYYQEFKEIGMSKLK